MVFCIWHVNFYLVSRFYSSTFSKVKLIDTICISFDGFNTLIRSYIVRIVSLLLSNDGIIVTDLKHDLLVCRVSSCVYYKRFAFISYITVFIFFFIDNPAFCIWISPARYHWVIKLSSLITAAQFISTCKGIFKFWFVNNIVNGCDVVPLNHSVLVMFWYFNLFNSIFLEVMSTNNQVGKLTIFCYIKVVFLKTNIFRPFWLKSCIFKNVNISYIAFVICLQILKKISIKGLGKGNWLSTSCRWSGISSSLTCILSPDYTKILFVLVLVWIGNKFGHNKFLSRCILAIWLVATLNK